MVVDALIQHFDARFDNQPIVVPNPFPGMPARAGAPEVPLNSWHVTLVQNRTHPREHTTLSERVEQYWTEIVKAHHVEGELSVVCFYLNDDMVALFPVDRVVPVIKISDDT